MRIRTGLYCYLPDSDLVHVIVLLHLAVNAGASVLVLTGHLTEDRVRNGH